MSGSAAISAPAVGFLTHCATAGTLSTYIPISLFGCTGGMWKFPGQGWNPCYSIDLSSCATREFLYVLVFQGVLIKSNAQSLQFAKRATDCSSRKALCAIMVLQLSSPSRTVFSVPQQTIGSEKSCSTETCLTLTRLFFLFFIFYFFVFSGLHPQHMEAPRLRVKSELQPLAYTTATASKPYLRPTPHLTMPQCRILNPLNEARD